MSEPSGGEASPPNAEQIRHWNENAGPAWVRNQARVDAMIRPHEEALLRAVSPAAGEAVLDVGCGCGTRLVELARRVGAEGRAVGVDVSKPMLEEARRRAGAAGVRAELFLEVGPGAAVLREAEDADALRARITEALRDAFRPHVRPHGLRVGSAAWLATAHRPA